MKYSEYYLPTLREAPADAVVVSHKLMLRAGMIRRLGNGLYAYLPLGLKAFRKVEDIIRQEMAAIGSLEIKPTVVVPGDVWKESGRWQTMGEGMLRAKNRLGMDLVVSPTAEEAVTAIIRDELSSYKQLPINVYQINTKYRDEIRPRYGVMRGREFVMKDAYTYNADAASLDASYNDMGAAYTNIFKRCGLTVIGVKADSGAMGGSGSQEFMVESEIGDNTLILCPSCGYAANVEKAACRPDAPVTAAAAPLTKIPTPNVKTIPELCAFLQAPATRFIKTLIYKAVSGIDVSFYAVLIRGDLDVNETKLAAFLGACKVAASEVMLASPEEVAKLTGAPLGFAGPVGLKGIQVIADESISTIENGITGALEADMHYTGVTLGRDFTPWQTADLRTVKAGDLCVNCGAVLYEKKGNELGHIFKLGDKYTSCMHVSYLDEAGKAQTPIMGSYGIGLDRTLASIIEEHHDDAGIIWPASVAPFHVSIIPIKNEGAVKEAAGFLAAELEKRGIDPLVDDRAERPGVKFNDADLLGFPFRVVIGDKTLSQSGSPVEVKRRTDKEPRLIPLAQAADEITAAIREELART